MRKKENPNLDRVLPTKESFPGLVSLDTVNNAGFNNWEPSMLCDVGGEILTVFIGDQVLRPNVNIIVGCRHLINRNRVFYEWYFGTFIGKPRGETDGRGETEEFDRKLRDILRPENVVDGYSLERRIKSIVDKK